jgi:diguanylate cyclase (GGDEF)-like protein
MPLRLEDGTIDGFIAVGEDVTEQREEARRLLHLSERDPLTALSNRSGFESQLKRCFESGHTADVAVLYIDLDHFKPVNDQHGHGVGDEVLRQFATRLESLVRPTDVAARLGGDEFAILLRDVREIADAERVAEKIESMARRPFDVDGRFIAIGASVGVAHGSDGEDGAWRLVERADEQMYAVKRAGRPGVDPGSAVRKA